MGEWLIYDNDIFRFLIWQQAVAKLCVILINHRLIRVLFGSGGNGIGVHVGIQAVDDLLGLHGGAVDAHSGVDAAVGHVAQVEKAVEEVHGGEFLAAVRLQGCYTVRVLLPVSL